MTETSLRVSRARAEMSFKFPMGVATTKSRAIFLFCVLSIGGFLSGCQSPGNEAASQPSDRSASTLIESNNQSDRQSDFRDIQAQLSEIRAFIVSRRLSAATHALDELNTRVTLDSLAPVHRHSLAILEAKLAALTDPALAGRLIDEIAPETSSHRRTIVQLRAEFQALHGDYQEGVRTLLNSAFADELAQQELIWKVVRATPAEQQRQYVNNAESNKEQAWWELGLLDGSSLSLNARKLHLETWETAYDREILQTLPIDEFVPRLPQPQHVALLLPQTGSLSAAAQAIRDGFIHAQLLDSRSNKKMRITVLDTSNRPMQQVARQAIEKGVDAIVGPLDKEHLRELTQLSDLGVPIVALNRVELSSRTSSLYQLGLVVEDDVLMISDLLSAHGINRVILMQGASSWATRAAMTFINNIGPETEIVSEVALSNLGEITEAVSEVLHVSKSNERFNTIKQISLNDIEFIPRRRQDIDGIVAFLGKAEFEILSAALEFHFADDVKLFVTEPSIRELTDSVSQYEGIHFTMSPVFTDSSAYHNEIHEIAGSSADAISLHALGFDAYRIVNHLELLRRGIALRGATGRISLDSQGILIRQPILRTVSNGEVRALSVPMPTATLRNPPT